MVQATLIISYMASSSRQVRFTEKYCTASFDCIIQIKVQVPKNKNKNKNYSASLHSNVNY
jgi:hypothetical protein